MTSILFGWIGTGCAPQTSTPCSTYDEVFVYTDTDNDGFGDDQPIGYVCEVGTGQSTNNVDCDDTRPDVHPNAEELCDLVDNDCNDLIDETHTKVPWYPDIDGDGFGDATEQSTPACQAPGAAWTTITGDCDDDNDTVYPGAVEVCDGIDNDCDTATDDQDPGVDPLTRTNWYEDTDQDGYGDPDTVLSLCDPPAQRYTDIDGDCDDTDPTRHPDALEVCDNLDNDCDDLTDDEDPSIDPTTQQVFAADDDGDGFGHPTQTTLACEPTPGYGVDNTDDCDDTDPWVNIPHDWYVDNDGDGWGTGGSIAFSCFPPAAGLGPWLGDCNDNDPAIHPDADEICNDLIDHDCNGRPNCCDLTVEVEYQGTCYYLDGSGGNCDADYVLAPQSILNDIARDFVGLTYKHQVSNNCCVQHADQAVELQDWGMDDDCNQAGIFTQGPIPGGAGCDNANQLNSAQLTLCQSL